MDDPCSWIEPECIPDGFQWADPSKIRIGDIFLLLEHWRERRRQRLSPLIWVTTCPLLRHASPTFEDRQRYQSDSSTGSSSSDGIRPEPSSSDPHLNSDASRLNYISVFDVLWSYTYFLNNFRPISEEPQARSTSATSQSPTSSHGNEWGGYEDSEMNPPSSPQREFPQDDIGTLEYSPCCQTWG